MWRWLTVELIAFVVPFGCVANEDPGITDTDIGGTMMGGSTTGTEAQDESDSSGDDPPATTRGQESSTGEVDCPELFQEFGFTGEVETVRMPDCVTRVEILAEGAAGGDMYNSLHQLPGGYGASILLEVDVPPGAELRVLVGQQPIRVEQAAGGGGASFVALGDTPLVVAGGGGGSDPAYGGGDATEVSTQGPGIGGTSYRGGSGGAGWSADGEGKAGGESLLAGGAGGLSDGPVDRASDGGFGGGGAAGYSQTIPPYDFYDAGGGGGFDGGDAYLPGVTVGGLGGTSYVDPSAERVIHNSAPPGNGLVRIHYFPGL